MRFLTYTFLFFVSGCGLLKQEFGFIPAPEACDPISDQDAALGSEVLSGKNLIAHGGGMVNQIDVSNSLEALNTNYEKGFRLFELDFSRTSDGHLVGIHDWERWANIDKNYSSESPVPTKDQFLNAERTDGLTGLSLKEIQIWLAEHSDTTLITDIKTDNTYAFNYLGNRGMDLSRIIPEVFGFREYLHALKIGVSKPMLSYYRLKSDDQEILEFVDEWDVQYVAIPMQKAISELPRELKRRGVCVFAHTTNDRVEMDTGLLNGVHGFYSDSISPADLKKDPGISY